MVTWQEGFDVLLKVGMDYPTAMSLVWNRDSDGMLNKKRVTESLNQWLHQRYGLYELNGYTTYTFLCSKFPEYKKQFDSIMEIT